MLNSYDEIIDKYKTDFLENACIKTMIAGLKELIDYHLSTSKGESASIISSYLGLVAQLSEKYTDITVLQADLGGLTRALSAGIFSSASPLKSPLEKLAKETQETLAAIKIAAEKQRLIFDSYAEAVKTHEEKLEEMPSLDTAIAAIQALIEYHQKIASADAVQEIATHLGPMGTLSERFKTITELKASLQKLDTYLAGWVTTSALKEPLHQLTAMLPGERECATAERLKKARTQVADQDICIEQLSTTLAEKNAIITTERTAKEKSDQRKDTIIGKNSDAQLALKIRIHALEDENARLLSETAILKESVEKNTKLNHAQGQLLINYKDKLNASGKSVEKLEAAAKEAAVKIVKQNKSITELKLARTELSEEVNALKISALESDRTIQEATISLNELKSTLQTKNNVIEVIKEEKTRLLSSNTEQKKETHALSKTNQKLTTDLDASKAALESAILEGTLLTTTNSVLLAESKAVRLEICELNSTIERLQLELKDKNDRLVFVNQELNEEKASKKALLGGASTSLVGRMKAATTALAEAEAAPDTTVALRDARLHAKQLEEANVVLMATFDNERRAMSAKIRLLEEKLYAPARNQKNKK